MSGANRKIPILILRPEQAYCISYPGLLQGPGIFIPKINNSCYWLFFYNPLQGC